jgi:hypothetical protein
MTAGSSVLLQLGSSNNATSTNDIGAYSKVFTAITTPDQLAAARQGLVPSSLDKLDIVVSASDLITGGGLYNPMELANWVPFLRTAASVSIQVTGAAAAADLQPVHTSFLLAGLSSSSERREADGSRVLTATRKVTATVRAVPLKKKKSSAAAAAVVTLSLDDDDDDDMNMMIDEDNLLSDDVLAPPPAMGARAAEGDDCAGRAPCADCSCGRAEQEAGGAVVSAKPTTAPSSSCGSCSLGDAFRCAGCPYLGKPAFKAGEEHLVLQLSDDL